MLIDPLIEAKAELTDGGMEPEPIVISTRIRLARNLNGFHFPGWADAGQRDALLAHCHDKLAPLPTLADGLFFAIHDLSPLEREVLLERRLISRELMESRGGGGALIVPAQHLSLMINEEDHLRIQCLRSGFNLRDAWREIDALDSEIEQVLDYAFSDQLGYLTACPTNLGTGMRASAMLHLPGLVMREHMEKVIRMVNQLGMAVRGSFGEGSEPVGSIFQISNQQTLGESEEDILKRLINILHAIIEQEQNARGMLLERDLVRLRDKIGRAYGILQNGHLLSSEEAMNLLSLMRLAVDLNLLPGAPRASVDRLMMEVQPGHVQYSAKTDVQPQERDRLRATRIREQFAKFGSLHIGINTPKMRIRKKKEQDHGTDE